MAYATKQYQAVLRCLEERAGQTLTAADLLEDLRRTGNPVGLATIYRQLEKLESAGRIHKVTTEEGALYQYCLIRRPTTTASSCGARTAAASSIWTAPIWRACTAIWRRSITSALMHAALY